MDRDTRELIKRLSVVAIPIMLQSLVQSGLGFLDTLMIGQLGETEIAATGGANQFFFFVQIAFFGLNSGGSIFLAQYFGAKNYDGMKKVLALTSTLAVILGAIGSLVAIIFPSSLMAIFSADEGVIRAGVTYLKAVGVSYIFAGFSMTFSGAFRASGDSRTPMAITIASLLSNAILNALLIFGLGPFPRMGILGGAVATSISRALEAILLLAVAVKRRAPFLPRGRKDYSWEKSFISEMSRTGLPAFLHDTFWVIGSIIYKVAYSRLGTGTFAAVNIDMSIQDLFFVAAMGLANGSAVIIGNTIGEGDRERSERWGRKIMAYSIVIGVVMGVLELTLGPAFISLYNITPDVMDCARKGLMALSATLPMEMMAVTIIVGILRSGGDSTYAMLSELVPMYALSIPLAFIGAYLGLPLWILFLMKLSENTIKSIVGFIRIRSGKWIRELNTERN